MSLIDSPSFDPSKAFVDLITTHTFEELLLLENNLTSEIKSLDGNMQTLVYENYNKFISATDTIRSMKSHVESMESEMKHLEESLQKVHQISSKVSEKVSPKQQQICKLINVYEELQKIKNICDLPSVLKTAIERNSNKLHIDFESASKSYSDSITFLTQHKFDTSYASIYQETSECVEKIKKIIWDKINDLSLSPETFAKYCNELHLLGEEGERLPGVFCS
jgi:DNA repair ATPase RecN